MRIRRAVSPAVWGRTPTPCPRQIFPYTISFPPHRVLFRTEHSILCSGKRKGDRGFSFAVKCDRMNREHGAYNDPKGERRRDGVAEKKDSAVGRGAIILALGAVCALYISRDKPAMSTVGMLSSAEILVLDAGHGGEDGGAVSAAGVPESHINLQIVQKMEQLFTFVGESTTLTRTGPDAIYSGDAKTLREKKISDLNNRVEMINQTPRGFLISIHQNSLPGTRPGRPGVL